jgi:hypothetical protein
MVFTDMAETYVMVSLCQTDVCYVLLLEHLPSVRPVLMPLKNALSDPIRKPRQGFRIPDTLTRFRMGTQVGTHLPPQQSPRIEPPNRTLVRL